MSLSEGRRADTDLKPGQIEALRTISASSKIYLIRGRWKGLGGFATFHDQQIAALDRRGLLQAPPEPGDGIARRELSPAAKAYLRLLQRSGRGL